MRWLVRLIYLVILIFFGLFGTLLINQEAVSVKFINWQSPEYDLFWWLLGSVLLGIFIGWLMSSTWLLRSKLNERRERKEKNQVKNELEAAQTQIAEQSDATSSA